MITDAQRNDLSFFKINATGAQLHHAQDSLNPTCKRVEWLRKWKCVIPKVRVHYRNGIYIDIDVDIIVSNFTCQ